MQIEIVETEINNQKRFIVVNEETKEVLDDSNGNGFKYIEYAYKSSWFRYGDSEQNVIKYRNEIKKYFDENPTIRDFILEYYNEHFSGSMKGLKVTNDLIEAVKNKFRIELNENHIKYL